MNDALFVIATLAASWLLTAAMRRIAVASQLLDVPNSRSSHVTPTPRGGGVAIVLSFLAAILVLGLLGRVPRPLVEAVVPAGAWVATVGFIDDRWHLSARWRLLAQFVAAGWLVWHLLPPSLSILGFSVEAGALGALLTGVLIVWMINLFNFMDGIDGLASLEAASVSVAAAIVALIANSESITMPMWLFAAATTGFLIWNRPPARIFMGDAGSGFLGVVVAALTLSATANSAWLLWSWLILVGAFMTDATVTLIRRVLRGEKFYLAHRSHAYQYASRLYQSHKVVTLAFGAINVFWLFPWALAVALGWIDGLLALVMAYTPLVLLVFHYKAGDRAGQGDLA